MPQFVVTYANGNHVALSGVQIGLSTGGAPIASASGSGRGRHAFAIPTVSPGTEFVLSVTVPVPEAWHATGNLLALEQPLRIEGTPDAPTIVAGTSPRWRDSLHPRIKSAAFTGSSQVVAATGGEVRPGAARPPAARVRPLGPIVVELDLDFIDVTNIIRHRPALPPSLSDRRGLEDYDAATAPTPGTRPHYDVSTRIYCHMASDPPLWVVASPPAALQKVDPDCVVFYRPQGSAYTSPLNVDLGPLCRYLLDAPSAYPGYLRLDDGASRIVLNPPASFERQLATSRVGAVFVQPIPNEGDYGAASNARLIPALESLFRALWADGLVGKYAHSGVRRRHLALAAFSLGGHPATAALTTIGRHVDQAFLFDANDFSQRQAQIEAWYRQGGKRLRLIGGTRQNAAMIGTAARLCPNHTDESVSLWAADAEYFRSNAAYQQALLCPDMGVDGFTPTTGGPLTALTQKTGIYLVPRQPGANVFLQARSESGASFGDVDCGPCGVGELAYTVWCAWVRPRENEGEAPRRAESLASLREVVARAVRLTTALESQRHQWPMCGGVGAAYHGADFKGFFQLCLEATGW